VAVINTESLDILKTQGFTPRPFKQDVPVTFHPENIQPGPGLAVRFRKRPTVSEHPDGHDGLTEPSPTIAVVSVADDAAHDPWVQVIVTMMGGALCVSP